MKKKLGKYYPQSLKFKEMLHFNEYSRGNSADIHTLKIAKLIKMISTPRTSLHTVHTKPGPHHSYEIPPQLWPSTHPLITTKQDYPSSNQSAIYGLCFCIAKIMNRVSAGMLQES